MPCVVNVKCVCVGVCVGVCVRVRVGSPGCPSPLNHGRGRIKDEGSRLKELRS